MKWYSIYERNVNAIFEMCDCTIKRNKRRHLHQNIICIYINKNTRLVWTRKQGCFEGDLGQQITYSAKSVKCERLSCERSAMVSGK